MSINCWVRSESVVVELIGYLHTINMNESKQNSIFNGHLEKMVNRNRGAKTWCVQNNNAKIVQKKYVIIYG